MLYGSQSDWSDALEYFRRSADIIIRRAERNVKKVIGQAQIGKAKSEAERNNGTFWAIVKATYRTTGTERADDPKITAETFQIAQWALNSEAATSIAEMAARGAMGNPALAVIVRERQDLVGEWRVLDEARSTALSQPPEKRDRLADASAAARLDAIDARVSEIDKRLADEFPHYAALVSPQPLTLPEIKAQLRDGEALLLFLDTPALGPIPGETFVWAVTKTESRWARVALGSSELAERVFTLRCGLDSSNWTVATDWLETTDETKRHKQEQIWRRETCRRLTHADAADTSSLPFDTAKAHELYEGLFSEIADRLKNPDGTGKHLLIVPSGPLTQLPFHVLITSTPDPSLMGVDVYRQAAWLARQNPITVLPTVSSVKALRALAKESHAVKPFIGFGNPLLDGEDESFGLLAKSARERQQCPKEPLRPSEHIAARGGIAPLLRRNNITDVDYIRAQTPLPETADELCAIAHDLSAGDGDIYLGASASEMGVKSLSESGALARYKIVEFATHGALAGQMRGSAEPGLILTPPEQGTEEDDGYLSASEVAGLKLDADWVILSACNTAAAGSDDSEALSGLARSFFYAGARSLLVSHWSVNSNATVKLITKAVAELKADPKIGRAEAMRRSMLTLIDNGKPYEAHPAYWAPFVGGGRRRCDYDGHNASRSSGRGSASPDNRSHIPRPGRF